MGNQLARRTFQTLKEQGGRNALRHVSITPPWAGEASSGGAAKGGACGSIDFRPGGLIEDPWLECEEGMRFVEELSIELFQWT